MRRHKNVNIEFHWCVQFEIAAAASGIILIPVFKNGV